jgi:hypothetical protein
MMGERRVMQEALFYGFSLERHVPDSHMLRKIDRFVDLSEVRPFVRVAVLQRDGSPFDRSRADDPDADRGLLLWHSLGAVAVRRGPPQSCLSLVSLGGHGLSTPLFSAGQVGSARKGSGFFACSTPGGVGGQDGLRRIGRPSSATRPAGKCRTVATSDAGSSDPRPLPGAPFRLVGGTLVLLVCVPS